MVCFSQVYETHFKDKDVSTFKDINWRNSLSSEDTHTLSELETALQTCMSTFLKYDNHYVFVKTSSRSAKDAPMYGDAFRDLYKAEMESIPEIEERKQENTQITCLLTAAFKANRMTSANEVIFKTINHE